MLKTMPPSKAYRLLESGPIVLVSTSTGTENNVMTMGFHMMLQHDPALIACVIGPWDFSYQALVDTGECVIALPTIDLAEKVVHIGNCSGQDINKFEAFELTALPAKTVQAPLIAECIANLECRVVDQTLTGRYNLFILKVNKIWLDEDRAERRLIHHAGDGVFMVDGETIDLGLHMTRWRYLMD
ncbi:flavin reductase family protein [Cupriavidus sp. BIC8F]|uniref:flavin reductase family protein n=1 Tax=Cupriavidus sp. BIC8F TaxID=3079014 RepID=UPI002916D3F2|nr:flavin reductase family protein [Cupriavidus sp. BIC8F]